jgi:hypothetical protein
MNEFLFHKILIILQDLTIFCSLEDLSLSSKLVGEPVVLLTLGLTLLGLAY